jgi:CHAT domain-containing protein/predicted negative regulator of RcsB-dependent stress response
VNLKKKPMNSSMTSKLMMSRCVLLGMLSVIISADCAAAQAAAQTEPRQHVGPRVGTIAPPSTALPVILTAGDPGQELAGTPVDPAELVRTAIANKKRAAPLARNYADLLEWRAYDTRGNPSRHGALKFAVGYVNGSWHHDIIERDGKPLLKDEAEEDRARAEQAQAQIKAGIPKQHGTVAITVIWNWRQLVPVPIPFEDLPRLFDLKSLGTENVGDRQAYVIEAIPRPGATPTDSFDEEELRDRVKLWIDTKEKVCLRLHFDVIEGGGLLAKGSSFDEDYAKTNNDIWMPARSLLIRRVAGQLYMQIEETYLYSKNLGTESDVTQNSIPPAPANSQLHSPDHQEVDPAPVPTADEVAIRDLGQKAFVAYEQGDASTFLSLFSTRSPILANFRMDVQRDHRKIKDEGLEIGRIEITGDTATARVSYEQSSVKGGPEEPDFNRGRRFYTYRLVREAGDWKLWDESNDQEELAESLIIAKSEEERDRLLAKNTPLVTAALANQLVNAGNERIEMGDYAQAMTGFHLAYTMAERLNDKSALWKAVSALGYGNLVQGNAAQAADYFQKGVTLCESFGNKSSLAHIFFEIGEDYFERGDYREAMEYYQKSLTTSEEAGNKKYLASTLELVGDLFVQQGNDEQALAHYQRSLELYSELEANVDTKLGVTNALGRIAGVLTRQGKYTEALDYYQKNLHLSDELDYNDVAAVTWRNMGDNYSLQGQFTQALESYEKSLDLFEESDRRPDVAVTLNRIGNVYYKLGNYDRTIDFCRRAADIAQGLDNPPDLAVILTTLGTAYLATGKYDQAQQALTGAISNIETLRTHVAGTEEDQERFFEDKVNPYYAMVELLIQEHKLTEALNYAERAKGRVLFDLLRNGRADITGTMTAEERSQEERLNQALVRLNSQLIQETLQRQPNKVILRSLEGRRKEARLAYEAFQTQLYAGHPDLKIRRGVSAPLSLEELGALIPDNSTAFLEYVVAQEETYLFVLTRSGKGGEGDYGPVTLKVYPIKIRAEDLANRTENFRAKLANNSLDFRGLARELYGLLLGPAQKDLAGKKTIGIVPAGALWELPFQALLSGQNRYVLEDHGLFYAPSLSVLREMRSKSAAADSESQQTAIAVNAMAAHGEPGAPVAPSSTRMLFAVGDPALPNHLGLGAKVVGGDVPYDPLPEQGRMVKQLGQIYGLKNSMLLTGSAAKVETVKAEAGKYRILHFATHGILDNDNPLYSHLLLAGNRTTDSGFLEAREIMQLDLHADVAVLSACDTARGRVRAGEGLIGMTWALFIAGTPTTVVSQWKVDSASTASVMIAFHRILKFELSQREIRASRKEPLRHLVAFSRQANSQSSESEADRRVNKADALRQAALKLMSDPQYRHPFYWAGFVVMGDGL